MPSSLARPREVPAARTIGGMVGRTGDTSLAHDALRECRLFAGLDEPTLGIVAAALRPRRFRRGETIFHVDDPGDALFIVTSGRVKITIPPGDGSEPAILTTIAPGGFFGELALLDGAAAIRDGGRARRRGDPGPAARRLRSTRGRAAGASTRAARGPGDRDPPADGPVRGPPLPGPARPPGPPPAACRCRAATTAASWRPQPDGGEQRLPWPYTQGELAGMIGGSRQSVNRLLADFVAQGLLRFEGDDLVIPDAARLAAAARR